MLRPEFFYVENVTLFDVDSPKCDPEWDMGDFAETRLFPVCLFNSISAVMSLFGFWVWLFFSPHNPDVARDRDRTCKSRKHFPGPISRVPFTSCIECFFLFSRQSFCAAVGGELSRCCLSIRTKLRSIRSNKHGCFS